MMLRHFSYVVVRSNRTAVDLVSNSMQYTSRFHQIHGPFDCNNLIEMMNVKPMSLKRTKLETCEFEPEEFEATEFDAGEVFESRENSFNIA